VSNFQLKNNSRERQSLTVFVRSKKLPVRSVVVERYAQSLISNVKIATRVLEYEDQLDDGQKKILEYANDLSATLALPIKIVDLSKRNLFERLLSWFSGQNHDAPTLILSKGALYGITQSVNHLSLPNNSEGEFASTLQNNLDSMLEHQG
jgi:hypothetical protein